MKSLLKLWTRVWEFCGRISKSFFLVLLASYRTIGTIHLGGSCRFEPSCSAYAVEAINTHHVHQALWLITKRVCKCRPGGPYGYDPVPPRGGMLNAAKE